MIKLQYNLGGLGYWRRSALISKRSPIDLGRVHFYHPAVTYMNDAVLLDAAREGGRLVISPSDTLRGYVAIGAGPFGPHPPNARSLRDGIGWPLHRPDDHRALPQHGRDQGAFGHGESAALVAQLLVTTAALGVVVGGPISGWLVEKIGVSTVVNDLAALWIVRIGRAFSRKPGPCFLPSRFGLGLGCAAIFTSTITYLGDSFIGGGRAKMLGFKTTVAAGFAVISVLLSAEIAEAAGWRIAFGGALAVFLLVIVFVSVEDTAQERAIATPRPPAGALLNLWPVYAVVLFVSTITILNQTQMPLLLKADHDGVGPSIIARIISAGTISYTIGSLFYGVLHQRLGAYRMFALCLALIGTGAAILGLSHDLWLSVFGAIPLGWGGGMMQPYMVNVLLDRAAPEARGRAIGFLSPAVNLGQFLSPLFFFLLFTGLGGHGAFLAIGGALFVAALVGLRTGIPKFRSSPSLQPVQPRLLKSFQDGCLRLAT